MKNNDNIIKTETSKEKSIKKCLEISNLTQEKFDSLPEIKINSDSGISSIKVFFERNYDQIEESDSYRYKYGYAIFAKYFNANWRTIYSSPLYSKTEYCDITITEKDIKEIINVTENQPDYYKAVLEYIKTASQKSWTFRRKYAKVEKIKSEPVVEEIQPSKTDLLMEIMSETAEKILTSNLETSQQQKMINQIIELGIYYTTCLTEYFIDYLEKDKNQKSKMLFDFYKKEMTEACVKMLYEIESHISNEKQLEISAGLKK